MPFNLLKYTCYVIGFFILLSCSTSNNVASNKLFQKRKYQKGWHLNSSPRMIDLAVANNTEPEIVTENTEQNPSNTEDSTAVNQKVVVKSDKENDHTLETEPFSSKYNNKLFVDENISRATSETFETRVLVEKEGFDSPKISQELDEDIERILRAILGLLVLIFTGIAPLAVWIAIGEGGSLTTSIKLFVGTLVLLGAFIATVIFSLIGTAAAAGGTLVGLLIFFGIAFVIMALVTFFHAVYVIIRGY